MKENRTKVVKIRLTEGEREQVITRAKKEGMTLSSYIRKSILGEKFISKTDIQTAFELKKIGTNINQLSRHVNTLPVDDNIRESIQYIEEYIMELKGITNKLL